MFDYDRYGNAFVDMRLHRLRVLITEQSDSLFVAHGITAPSAAVSVLLFLLEKNHGSIAQIADALGYSHQLINHRLNQLEKLGFTQRFSDVRDKRKWRIKLTASGVSEAKRIEAALPMIAAALDELFAAEEITLSPTLDRLHVSLSKKSLLDRSSPAAANNALKKEAS